MVPIVWKFPTRPWFPGGVPKLGGRDHSLCVCDINHMMGHVYVEYYIYIYIYLMYIYVLILCYKNYYIYTYIYIYIDALYQERTGGKATQPACSLHLLPPGSAWAGGQRDSLLATGQWFSAEAQAAGPNHKTGMVVYVLISVPKT